MRLYRRCPPPAATQREEITIAYLDPTEAYEPYRASLKKQYFFDPGEVDDRGFGQ